MKLHLCVHHNYDDSRFLYRLRWCLVAPWCVWQCPVTLYAAFWRFPHGTIELSDFPHGTFWDPPPLPPPYYHLLYLPGHGSYELHALCPGTTNTVRKSEYFPNARKFPQMPIMRPHPPRGSGSSMNSATCW